VTDHSGRPIYLGEPAGVIIQVQDKVIFHAGGYGTFLRYEIDRRGCGNRSGFLADRRAFRNGAERRGQGCGVPTSEREIRKAITPKSDLDVVAERHRSVSLNRANCKNSDENLKKFS
jgi:hypothetical protein